MLWRVTQSHIPLPACIESSGTRQLEYLMQSAANADSQRRDRPFGRLTFKHDVGRIDVFYGSRRRFATLIMSGSSFSSEDGNC